MEDVVRIRQQPQSLEAERALLGGLLLDNAQIPNVAEVLEIEDFYSQAHAAIYKLMVEQSARNEPLDVLGLADHVVSTNKVEEFGGLAYVTGLPEQVPTTENLAHFFYGELRERLPKTVELRRVRVWEAPTYSATYGY